MKVSRNGKPISTPRMLFERHVRRSDGCWEWGAYRNAAGYGQTRVGGRATRVGVLAHRLSWEVHRGPIPVGLHVLHSCDTPACVRPDHLFLGTNADNIADRVRKGRPHGLLKTVDDRRGERHPNAKLTNEQVREIRARHATGASNVTLANEYGIHRGYVSHLVHGATRR